MIVRVTPFFIYIILTIIIFFFSFSKDFTKMDNNWEEYDTYWISNHEQASKEWFDTRKYRITGSNYGAAINHSNFSTPQETMKIVAGFYAKTFSDESLSNMRHGRETEPIARDWYEKSKNCKVIERGIAIPKWNKYMGSSVDGEVIGQNGIIEIKCPKRMYRPLLEKSQSGITYDKYYHKHIWDSHYDQMIGNMAVMNKEWCDYIVYSTFDSKVYLERIYFNEKYWNEVLYPGLKFFIEQLKKIIP